MATPLRAFLMRRPMGGEWDVAVYQTLEDVLRAWETGREDAGLAVLHIGFDRKPARVYEEAAALHPGRLVLTEGVRGALPATFATSSRPIALIDEAPMFLALRGWGYEAEDTAPVEPEPKRRFSDWVVELCWRMGDDGLRRAAYRGGWKPA